MSNQPRVPEAVREAFYGVLNETTANVPKTIEEAFEAALAKYNELLLGDGARAAVYGALPRGEEDAERAAGRVIQAAIDSVMKGEGDG